jgi:transcriptional regulator with XRE-family HTH domain
MIPGGGRSPTPREIAMYGHIAAALRAAMEARGMSPADLNQAMGKERSYAGAYHWFGSKGAPGPDARAKLSKLLGIPIQQLMRRDPGGLPVEAGPVLQIEGPRATPQKGSAPPVLQFLVDGDGMSRIKLDVSLPTAQAVPLLRLLLDAGMIVGRVDT